MTESEAKTKWCPAYRVATSGGDVSSTFEMDNRPQQYERPGEDEPRGTPYKVIGLHEMGCCIGSQCMAWRQRHQWLDNAQQTPDWVSYAPYAFEPGPGQEREDGYCGLAGAPQ